MNKEHQLNSAFLLYASQCASEGDYTALRGIGFIDEEDIEALKDLSVSDLATLSSQGHVIRANVNIPALRLLLKHIKDHRLDNQYIDQLIHLNAPFELLNRTTGLPKNDFVSRRRLANMKSAPGRPTLLNREEQKKLWNCWMAVVGNRQATASDWITVAEQTGLDLRSCWATIQGWEKEHAIEDTAPVYRSFDSFLSLHQRNVA